MPDVRRLVRVDVGVLNDDLALGRGLAFLRLARHQRGAVAGAVQTHVDEAVARHLKRGHAGNRAELRSQFRGDRLGRALQLARELERDRERELAELRLLGRFDRHGPFESIAASQVRGNRVLEELFD